MDPALLALIAAISGALVTGLLTWLSSTSTSRRQEKAERRTMNLELCTQFLSTIDSDIRRLGEFEEQHGMMPADQGLEYRPKSEHDLTAIELRCPTPVFKAARELLRVTHDWANGPTTYQQLDSSRQAFIRAVQQKL